MTTVDWLWLLFIVLLMGVFFRCVRKARAMLEYWTVYEPDFSKPMEGQHGTDQEND